MLNSRRDVAIPRFNIIAHTKNLDIRGPSHRKKVNNNLSLRIPPLTA